VHVGVNYKVEDLHDFDAVVLCAGATKRRGLPIPGADAKGVVQAMEVLKRNNQVVDGLAESTPELNAKGKDVIVIGGGDTGSDCVGTSNRHGAKSVTNFEIMPIPPQFRSDENPWPFWPFTLKTSSSHEEGVDRKWSILTKEFVKDPQGHPKCVKTVEVKWLKIPEWLMKRQDILGSENQSPCDSALLDLRFTGPEETIREQLGRHHYPRSDKQASNTNQSTTPHKS